jgi:hypothetical protein
MNPLATDQGIDLGEPWTIVAVLLPFIVVFIGWLTRKQQKSKD